MPKISILNGTIITMNPERAIFKGDLTIEGNQIKAINPRLEKTADLLSRPAVPTTAAESVSPEELVIDATGKMVLPGFVQTHVHLCQALFRGQADDMELLDWLQKRIWPLEAAHTPESIYYSAMLGCAELFRGGTTCILDMETVHHTEAALQAILENGMRAVSGKVMMDYGPQVPAGLREDSRDSIRESVTLLNKWHGRDAGRIRYAFQPRFAVSSTEHLLRDIAALAADYGVLIHTHAAENQQEVELILRERGERNLLYLHRLGLTGPNLLLAHCIWLDEAELDVLQQTGTRVVHCPSSNLKLASGIARVPEMLARGISVSLGADGAPCNDNLDMFMEMRLAALIHKIRCGPTALPAAQVLEMATLGGAKALGLDAEIGSLEVGKRADLILVDLNGVHSQPEQGVDPVSRLVYSARATDVETTIIDGKVVMLNRRLLTINESVVVERCNQLLSQQFKACLN